jgi:hypothetical protein
MSETNDNVIEQSPDITNLESPQKKEIDQEV